MQYPISLTFGTQKGSIKAHLGTKFGWNMISSQGVISDYSQKITPICCHAYRVREHLQTDFGTLNVMTLRGEGVHDVINFY